MLPPDRAAEGGGDLNGKSLVLATAVNDGGTTSVLMLDGEQIGETGPTSLVIYNPMAVSYELYEEIGRLLGRRWREIQWYVGDWLNLVEDVYPDRYSQAEAATGLSPDTLYNRSGICRRIPRERRRPELSFSTHEVVAYLEPEAREEWLERAVENDWKRAELRSHLKEAGLIKDRPRPEHELPIIDHDDLAKVIRTPEEETVHTCPSCGHEWSV